MIQVRDATQDDGFFIYEVRTNPGVSAWLFQPPPARYDPGWLAGHPGRVFVAVADGQRAGYGQLKPRNRAAELGVCVAPERQRNGVGLALVRHMVAAAFEELGLDWVWLEVWRHNRRAMALYERCGFEVTGRRDNGNVIYMRLCRG